VKFYGERSQKKGRRSLGARMVEGAKHRRANKMPEGPVWLGKVLVLALTGAAAGEIIGGIAGLRAGSQELGTAAGCAAGVLVGALFAEGSVFEGLLGALFAGGLAAIDYFVIGWGGVPFYKLGRMSFLGLAGAMIGIILGRVLSREKQAETQVQGPQNGSP
jgi:hypothetical protein